jgi:hypothetical protein
VNRSGPDVGQSTDTSTNETEIAMPHRQLSHDLPRRRRLPSARGAERAIPRPLPRREDGVDRTAAGACKLRTAAGLAQNLTACRERLLRDDPGWFPYLRRPTPEPERHLATRFDEPIGFS